MVDWLKLLFADSALPNVHAAVVHFPIVLLPTALLLDLGSLVFRRRIWLDRSAVCLYLIGTIGAAAAYLSGQQASATMWLFPGTAQATMADHQELALATLAAFSAITLLRAVASWLSRNDRIVPIGFFRLVAMIAAVAGVLLLVVTADYGGRLVFRHGMGVEGAPFSESATAPSDDAD